MLNSWIVGVGPEKCASSVSLCMYKEIMANTPTPTPTPTLLAQVGQTIIWSLSSQNSCQKAPACLHFVLTSLWSSQLWVPVTSLQPTSPAILAWQSLAMAGKRPVLPLLAFTMTTMNTPSIPLFLWLHIHHTCKAHSKCIASLKEPCFTPHRTTIPWGTGCQTAGYNLEYGHTHTHTQSVI